MKGFFCIAALYSAIALSGCGGDYHRKYLEDNAGIRLPGGVSNVVHCTCSDIAFTSHYTIPPDSIGAFASNACLRESPASTWDPVLFLEELPRPWNTIPESGSFLYGCGSSGWNSWDILLDAETGEMWVTMYYTDASGDQPPN